MRAQYIRCASRLARAWRVCPLALAGTACAQPPPASQFPSARAAIDAMYEAGQCSEAVSGEGKMDYLGDDGRLRATVYYLAARPDSIRLDVVSPLGGSLSTLTSDGSQFALLDRTNRKFHFGPARTCSLEEFLRVPVPPHALVQLLSGEAPVLLHTPEQASLAWDAGHYVLQIQGEHGASEEIWMTPHPEDWTKPWDQQRLRVLRVVVQQNGETLYQVRLSEHESASDASARKADAGQSSEGATARSPAGEARAQCSAEIPRELRFIVERNGQDIVLEQETVEHNPSVGEAAFRQRPPAGVQIEPLLCKDR